jgi:hypothetical protein
MRASDVALTPKGYQKLNAVTATGLTVPAGAGRALIKVEAFQVRWRDSGGDPTATDGMLIATTDVPFLYTGNLRSIKFIDTAAGASTIHVSYYA